jgi:hypothetical protein
VAEKMRKIKKTFWLIRAQVTVSKIKNESKQYLFLGFVKVIKKTGEK